MVINASATSTVTGFGMIGLASKGLLKRPASKVNYLKNQDLYKNQLLCC